uniref:RNA-directed DNA polymerase, eukaryota n=1 Tax=Tanacetum cinerariifolium TaxID=118510 RepID=A0A6L2MHP1_TANCI|nr:RNA-directed DNA polymerase, eukaryota [Tanacetum cinerariifolium]
MFFKVDFAKAYDSVRWDHLLDVLKAFGFGPTWCNWIFGTLVSARASVLVNGSPTSEFSFNRGLKQGDPLAPFLFILVMESLHLSFSRASSGGVFNGIQINGSISISHLFYADDAMFIGEWSNSNLKNVIKMLQCFFYTSGLKINIDKCQLLGLGVSRNSVAQAAAEIGCKVLRHQFRYLGVTVGELMSRRSGWDDVVNKLRSRLSNWKVKTLSIGGRLTLLKSVLGASPLYYMSIFKTPKTVLKDLEAIRSKFFNGANSSETKITWIAWNVRDGAERQQWDELQVVLSTVSLSSLDDRRRCDLSGDGSFQVKEVRNCIDDLILPTHSEVTRWVKVIPKKINIFVWRARRDCLPTRHNLTLRGVSLVSDSCPLCEGSVEVLSSFLDWQSWFLSLRLHSSIKALLEDVFFISWWSLPLSLGPKMVYASSFETVDLAKPLKVTGRICRSSHVWFTGIAFEPSLRILIRSGARVWNGMMSRKKRVVDVLSYYPRLNELVLGSMDYSFDRMTLPFDRPSLDQFALATFRTGAMKRGRAKVSWDLVCRSCEEGGLGIGKLDLFNKALMITHIWNLISNKILQWSHVGPLSSIVTTHDMFRAGFNLETKVEELICNGRWTWPSNVKPFGVAIVWDRLRDNLKGLAGLSHVAGRYMDIVEYLIPFAKRRSCKSVIPKLVLSVNAYYLWQERNARLFSNQKRTVAQIVDVIKTSVRLKLLSCSFKKSKVGMEFVHL